MNRLVERLTDWSPEPKLRFQNVGRAITVHYDSLLIALVQWMRPAEGKHKAPHIKMLSYEKPNRELDIQTEVARAHLLRVLSASFYGEIYQL